MGIYSNPTRVFLDYATVTVFFLPHMFIFRPHFVNYIITLGSLFKACVYVIDIDPLIRRLDIVLNAPL